ncbi:MAG: hypothetical protein WKF84_09735 [Pyrinomonadaceae bacterium]
MPDTISLGTLSRAVVCLHVREDLRKGDQTREDFVLVAVIGIERGTKKRYRRSAGSR